MFDLTKFERWIIMETMRLKGESFMIQDIGEHKFDLSYKQPKAGDGDYVLYMKDNKTLLRKAEDGNHEIPKFADFPAEKEALKDGAYYLFSIDGIGYYYVREMAHGEEDGYELCSTSAFRKMAPGYQAFAGITATQIYRFKESRRFCGKCGHATEDSKTERAVVCPACGQIEYPKISPAIIVAITDGDRIILSRYRVSNNPYRGYALIAGFVEIGETFEDTVRREVMEEVGLKVKNVRYYKSQPWAFSDTEMIGFFAELDGDDKIRLQEDELSEAGWFHRDEVPDETIMNSIGSELKMVFKYGSLEKFYEATGMKPEAAE